MKKLIFILATLFTLSLTQNVWANNNTGYKCIYEPGDIVPIMTTGSTKSEARSRASKICFDRRMNQLEAQNFNYSEDDALDIIDSCTNICH